MTSRLLSVAACLLATGLASHAYSATHVFTPAADTYVSVASGQMDTNFGTEPIWRTRYGANTTAQRLGYVRFDLGDQLAQTIQSATLSLTFVSRTNYDSGNDPAIVNVYGVNLDYTAPEGKLGLDWGETELTNNNAPWAASGSSSAPGYVILLGQFSVPGGSVAGTTFSISTTALAEFLDTFRAAGQSSVTLIFRSSGGTFHSFASKEHGEFAPATLTLTTAASQIPEPSAAALLGGVSVLGCVVSRRRVRRSVESGRAV